MRRLLFPILGLIELSAAVALVILAVSLPGQADLRASFDGARRVTVAAGEHVRALRDEVGGLRRARLGQAADRLQASTRAVADALGAQRIDFDRVRVVRDAMDRSARGLEGLAESLDPEALRDLGNGLVGAADFLDRQVVPAAAGAADDLETASKQLQASARQFSRIAGEMPLDLAPIREVHDSLGRFDEGLTTMGAMLDPSRLAPLREATHGAEGVVTEAAALAERAAGYTYPVVELDGLRPKVRNRPFWPKGAEVGADLRKVAGGVTALGRELEGLSRELPRVQQALAESRKAIGATRRGLANALEHQEDVERLLKEMPAQSARLAEELPRMTGDLSQALRATTRLRALADALRLAGKGADTTSARWPEVRAGLAGSATLLRASRDQLDGVLEHRREYEAALEQLQTLADAWAADLPALAGRLDDRLDEQDRTLAEMSRGIDQVEGVLPAYAHALSRCLWIGRLLAWLVALLAGVHGVILLLDAWPGRRHPSKVI